MYMNKLLHLLILNQYMIKYYLFENKLMNFLYKILILIGNEVSIISIQYEEKEKVIESTVLELTVITGVPGEPQFKIVISSE